MQNKFREAGLRGIRRTAEEAERFYKKSIPHSIRASGETEIWKFLKGKHASHIKSVFNKPCKATDIDNLVWERSQVNIARGKANMTSSELMQARAKKCLEGVGSASRHALGKAAKAGCIGMGVEGLVSLTENTIYVCKGQKTREEALKSVGKDALTKGAASAAKGLGVSLVGRLGAGKALIAVASPVARPLMVVGGVVFAISTFKRIKTALDSTTDSDAKSVEHLVALPMPEEYHLVALPVSEECPSLYRYVNASRRHAPAVGSDAGSGEPLKALPAAPKRLELVPCSQLELDSDHLDVAA